MSFVVAKIWEDDKESLGNTANKNPLLAKTGFDYLQALEDEKAQHTERGHVVNVRSHNAAPASSSFSGIFLTAAEFVFTVGGVVVVGTIVASLLFLLYEIFSADWLSILSQMYREFASWLSSLGLREILGLLDPIFLMILPIAISPLIGRIFESEFVYVQVYPAYWRDKAAELLRSDRTILWSIMNSDEGRSVEVADAVKEDADLNLPSGELPPALPPGVTEIALANSRNGVEQIRKGLLDVRWNHKWLTRIFSAGFSVSIVVAMVGLLFFEFDPKLILGSGGFSAVTGAFTFVAMRNLRMANLALALYESYVAELADRLEMIPSQSGESASMEMQKAWRDFRLGVNDLHRLEQISLLPKKEQKDEGAGHNTGE